MSYPIGTHPPPERRIAILEASNEFLRQEAVNARLCAKREFWRGAVFGGAVMLGLVLAGAAFGLDISGSIVTLEPSADPRAFADVVFANNMANGPMDTGSYTLSQDGVSVGIRFTWDANFVGQDQIIITPPDGMACVPVDCTATVIEGQTGRVTLFPWQGA